MGSTAGFIQLPITMNYSLLCIPPTIQFVINRIPNVFLSWTDL